MDASEAWTLEDAVEPAAVFIAAAGNAQVMSIQRMGQMKSLTIVEQVRYFDNETQIAHLTKHKRTNMTYQMDTYVDASTAN